MERQVTKRLPIQDVSPCVVEESPLVPNLTVLHNPFSTQCQLMTLDTSWTVVEILRHAEIPENAWNRTVVTFDYHTVHRNVWHLARPKEGVRVTIRVTAGGGGGNILKSLLLIALAVAASVFAPYLAPLVFGGFGATALEIAVVQVGITVVGALAINALIPPSVPKLDSGNATSRTLSINAGKNAFKPFGTMPVVLGKHRVFPPYAAKPYTEIVGQDQYVRLLFVIGYKDLEITQLQLGDVSLADYTDVEYEILCGGSTDKDQNGDPVTAIKLFTAATDELTINTKLTGPATPNVQTTSINSDEFSIDIAAPGGLLRIDHSGDKKTIAVAVTFERKLAAEPDTSYVSIGSIQLTGQSAKAIRKGFRHVFPTRDQYTIRITRTSNDVDPTTTNDQVHQDDVFIASFRSITNENPVVHPDAALISLRIKATDQLNGAVDNFNCIASSILPDWDAGSSTWVTRETNNPASLYRGVLQGNAMARPVADSRVNLIELQAWHIECVSKSRTFNMYRDFNSTVMDTLQDIAAAGRARRAQINGVWTVVRDIAQTTYAQVVSEQNSWGFAAVKLYPELVHGFRVRFINEQQGYKNDERVVYDDGYNVSNATKFETLELAGVTNPDQVWADGRYHLAVARLRPETYSFNMDVEFLPVTPGAMIAFQQQSILVGLGSSRIKSLTTSGSNVNTITLEDAMSMDGVTAYGCRIRTDDGSTKVFTVQSVLGEQLTLTFTGTKPTTSEAKVGDLVLFGVSGLETLDLVVADIVPGKNLSATLKCFDMAPGIQTADTGTIPAHQTYISLPAGAAVPIISGIVSDESALIRAQDGTLQAAMIVAFAFANNRVDVQYLEVQYKLTSDSDWITLPPLLGDTTSAVITDVAETNIYDIRARYRYLDTTVSVWSAISTETVIGKTSPPPDVTTFLVQRQPDGTREYTWTLDTPPLDIAGFRIKYRLGTTGADWATNMTLLNTEGLLQTAPFESNLLAKGNYQIAIVAVDTGGRESANPLFINSSLGDPRIKNALVVDDARSAGWPGTKTNCWVNELDDLVPTSADTWDTLPATWDAWTSWNMNPSSPLIYEHLTADMGAIVAYTPLTTVSVASGTLLIEERHGNVLPIDGTWTSYTVAGDVVTSRYSQIRVTVTTPPVTGLTSMLTIFSADTIEDDIQDLDTSTLPVEAGGGIRLPLTKTFSLIGTVQLALQSVGSGYTWELIDKNPSLGPWVKIWNGTTLAYPVIDANIKGL